MMSFDEKCLELARHFLQDEPESAIRAPQALAEAIQTAVENWFEATEEVQASLDAYDRRMTEMRSSREDSEIENAV